MSKTKKSPPANIVWFEIPADDMARAKKFYNSLFGWKIKAFPTMKDYWHIDTGGADASPDGGMMKRLDKNQHIVNYILVPSVEKAMAKVKKLGGDICVPRTAVPGMGFFPVCMDTEGNTFAVWEMSKTAK